MLPPEGGQRNLLEVSFDHRLSLRLDPRSINDFAVAIARSERVGEDARGRLRRERRERWPTWHGAQERGDFVRFVQAPTAARRW